MSQVKSTSNERGTSQESTISNQHAEKSRRISNPLKLSQILALNAKYALNSIQQCLWEHNDCVKRPKLTKTCWRATFRNRWAFASARHCEIRSLDYRIYPGHWIVASFMKIPALLLGYSCSSWDFGGPCQKSCGEDTRIWRSPIQMATISQAIITRLISYRRLS